MPYGGNDWLALTEEPALEPEIPICHPHHHFWDFRTEQIPYDQQSPRDLDIHIITDNYATHKHPRVNKWLQRHPRFHMHFTPTSSPWMNLVERFFGELTPFISEKSFASTRELADAIIAFLTARNDNTLDAAST